MTSGLFILRLFQHLHGFMKQENKLFYSNQERFSLVCLDKSTILSVFFFFFPPKSKEKCLDVLYI